ncbi:DUF1049 domain-containing protein [Rhodococcus sp. 27YEA15]|uniref:DUF1049 domain-containing protein n=1 Tax=Rhodococcus sp. 27YEA15 TaxID=3156259 RepID=UPI003C7E71EF
MSTDAQNSAKTLATPRNIVAAVLVVVAVIFILQNRATTTIQLFWVSVNSPLWLTLVAVLLVGWIAGLLTTRRKKTKG